MVDVLLLTPIPRSHWWSFTSSFSAIASAATSPSIGLIGRIIFPTKCSARVITGRWQHYLVLIFGIVWSITALIHTILLRGSLLLILYIKLVCQIIHILLTKVSSYHSTFSYFWFLARLHLIGEFVDQFINLVGIRIDTVVWLSLVIGRFNLA